jgi:hypothetical protein
VRAAGLPGDAGQRLGGDHRLQGPDRHLDLVPVGSPGGDLLQGQARQAGDAEDEGMLVSGGGPDDLIAEGSQQRDDDDPRL